MKPLNLCFLFFIIVLIPLSSPHDADAHARTLSFSEWRQLDDAAWEVKAVLPVKEFVKMYGTDDWNITQAADYAYRHFTIDTSACRSLDKIRPVSTSHMGAEFIFEWEIRCEPGASDTPVIQINPFFSFATSHLHVAKFRIENKKIEKIITPGTTRITMTDLVMNPKKKSSSGKIFDFMLAGIHHLIIGPEHLLFVLALSLLASNVMTLLKIITAFTIAHAISLTPVLMGWITTDSKSVEALIGLSITIVAMEAGLRLAGSGKEQVQLLGRARFMTAAAIFAASFLAWLQVIPVNPLALFGVGMVVLLTVLLSDQKTTVSWIHAFGFGLVHGLGIAGTLGGKVMGADILIVLAGFNLGIEAGQIIAALILLLSLGILIKTLVHLEKRFHWPLKNWIKLSELPLYGICSCLMMAGVYLFAVRSII